MNETISVPFDVPSASPPAPRSDRLAFSGRRADFRRLVIRGTALELVTVGFYRFWLATDMRRHLWSNTAVEGDAAEYTGTAKELLIGFLFALAILAPIYLAYFLVGLEAERIKAFASLPLGIFFYLFAQFAIYRARRYRLTRTVWRGVRFWMTGSGVGYAWRAGLWALLSVLTLGFAVPWAKASLERYKMRHTAYGDLWGRFEGSGWSLFKQTWWLWLLLWASLFLALIPIPFIYATLKAKEWRWWLSGLRVGGVSFTSDLTDGALIGLYWKMIGWCVLLFVALSVWFGGVFAIGYQSVAASVPAQQKFAIALQKLPILFAAGFGYILVALAVGVVIRIYLMRDVWQRVVESVTVQNLAAADNVTAQGDLVSALGEGFADSLDIAGF
jgi:uncharacterized membrane protein YjgN (DUF898 family)